MHLVRYSLVSTHTNAFVRVGDRRSDNGRKFEHVLVRLLNKKQTAITTIDIKKYVIYDLMKL